jgi:hypothetical protein
MGIEPTSEVWGRSLTEVTLFLCLRRRSGIVLDNANSDLVAPEARNALCHFSLDRLSHFPRGVGFSSGGSCNLLHRERIAPRRAFFEPPLSALQIRQGSLKHLRVTLADRVLARSASRVRARAALLPTERLRLIWIASAWHCYPHSSQRQILYLCSR